MKVDGTGDAGRAKGSSRGRRGRGRPGTEPTSPTSGAPCGAGGSRRTSCAALRKPPRHSRRPTPGVPHPDTEPALRALRARGLRIGMVSDFAWDLPTHLARHGLADLIDTCVISCEVGREKPDPRLFLRACADLGADPRATPHGRRQPGTGRRRHRLRYARLHPPGRTAHRRPGSGRSPPARDLTRRPPSSGGRRAETGAAKRHVNTCSYRCGDVPSAFPTRRRGSGAHLAARLSRALGEGRQTRVFAMTRRTSRRRWTPTCSDV